MYTLCLFTEQQDLNLRFEKFMLAGFFHPKFPVDKTLTCGVFRFLSFFFDDMNDID